MSSLLIYFAFFPLVSFIISNLLPKQKEKFISNWALINVSIYTMAVLAFTGVWLVNGCQELDYKNWVLYSSPSFDFFLDYYFDKNTAVLSIVGGLVLILALKFSKYYMHRDWGYKRYFSTMMLFFTGYNFVIFAGNFETLFIGWEILGVCSFLLISFYRDRYLPVKNAMKVIYLYRLGDVCLLLAIWMCHHLFNKNISFIQLIQDPSLSTLISEHGGKTLFIVIMVLIAAAIKSALFPFSSWLPRAMEGPTSSSAIFYGSLSVHIGLFLMIRTSTFWAAIIPFKVIILLLGIITVLVSYSISRVQPTVKTQIAYNTITQLGIISMEIAMGWHTLALIHIVGHSFLRVYQLLISPSVLSYKVHDMVFTFDKTNSKFKVPSTVSNSLFVLGIKEWNLDWWQFRLLWRPFKIIGNNLILLSHKIVSIITFIVFTLGLLYFFVDENIPRTLDHLITIFYITVSLLLLWRSACKRGSALQAWQLIVMGQVMLSLAIAHNEHVPVHRILLYLSGSSIASIVGWIYLKKMERVDNDINLDKFHGYVYSHKMEALVFFICCLALLGFPFTPTFLGIDLLFTHIQEHQYILVILTALSFVFIEIALLRIYARVFMGQSKKLDHAMAFRAS